MKKFMMMAVLVGLLVAPVFAQVGMFEKKADWTLTTADNVKAPGSATVSGTNYNLQGNGNDIWNAEDEGYFVYTEKTGSFSITALLAWDDPGADPWSKMIVMIREKGDLPGSRYFGTQLRGSAYGDQAHATMRMVETGTSNSTQFFEPEDTSVAVQATNEGLWVRTTRVAELNMLYAEWSYDGKTWNLGGSTELPMQDKVAAGLAITSHTTDDYLVMGTFQKVSIGAPPTLPLVGRRSFSTSGFKAGEMIEVTVKVVNPNQTAPTTKVTEVVPAGWTVSNISSGGTVSGDTITWNVQAPTGSTNLTYKATAPAKPGSVNAWTGAVGTIATGGTAALLVTQDKPAGDQLFDQHADIYKSLDRLGGDGTNAGGAEYDPATKTYTVWGSGWDIWEGDDAFHFLYTTLSGDFKMSARIEHDESERSTGTDVWIKGMLMARQNLTPGSPNFGNRVRRDGQYSWQMRAAQDGASTSDSNNRVTFTTMGYETTSFPQVMIERKGNRFSIFYQDDAGAWVQVQSTQTLNLTDPILVGLAVTPHQLNVVQYTWFRDVKLERTGPVAVDAWELF